MKGFSIIRFLYSFTVTEKLITKTDIFEIFVRFYLIPLYLTVELLLLSLLYYGNVPLWYLTIFASEISICPNLAFGLKRSHLRDVEDTFYPYIILDTCHENPDCIYYIHFMNHEPCIVSHTESISNTHDYKMCYEVELLLSLSHTTRNYVHNKVRYSVIYQKPRLLGVRGNLDHRYLPVCVLSTRGIRKYQRST